jgi:hypothetical protein
MRARWSVNLLLSLLVATLGWTMLRDLRVAQEASRLTGMDPTKIEGLELVRPGKDTIKLERITGGVYDRSCNGSSASTTWPQPTGGISSTNPTECACRCWRSFASSLPRRERSKSTS